MSVFFLTSEFPPGPGGIGHHAYHLAVQLIKNGYQVFVSAPERRDFPSGGFDRDQQFSIVRNATDGGKVQRFFRLIHNIRKAGKDCSWIILSGLTNLALYTIVRRLTSARILCIAHGHEIIMAKGLSGFLVRRALQNANAVVAVSEFSRDLMVRNGITRSITVIPNGINLPTISRPKDKTPNSLILITVGSVTQRKGQHNVVNALPALIERFGNVEYHIVGIPRNRDKVESMAKSLGVLKSVIFHGAVDDQEKTELLTRADIFVMLSENLADGDVEGFGIAIVEANALGLPAVGSRGTGVEQAIANGMSGYLADAQNPPQVCESISRILDDYSTFSRNSVAWAQEHDWEKIVQGYMTILK
jgi:glycosyltransferase involved in cell wall biosynthesis